jgi:hypothetical protein
VCDEEEIMEREMDNERKGRIARNLAGIYLVKYAEEI